MKVGAKVAGECNFAPTFVRYSRFSSRASTGIFRKVRFYRPRIRLSKANYRFLRGMLEWICSILSLFLSFSFSRYFCVFVFDARMKKKFLIGS